MENIKNNEQKPKSGRRIGESLITDSNKTLKQDVVSEMYSRFIALGDPTEYKFALEFFGTWKDYLVFKANSKTYRKLVEEWIEELEIKLKSDALTTVITDALDITSKSACTSAKYIVEGQYNKNSANSRGRGRPPKELADRNKREAAVLDKLVEDDYARLTNIVTSTNSVN